jgi:hypothetical protein
VTTDKRGLWVFTLPGGDRLLVRADSVTEARKLAREWLEERERGEEEAA